MRKSLEQEQAEEMAWFCLLMKVQPSEYMNLTREEQQAFFTVYKQINKKRK